MSGTKRPLIHMLRDIAAHMLLSVAIRVGTPSFAWWLKYEMPAWRPDPDARAGS